MKWSQLAYARWVLCPPPRPLTPWPMDFENKCVQQQALQAPGVIGDQDDGLAGNLGEELPPPEEEQGRGCLGSFLAGFCDSKQHSWKLPFPCASHSPFSFWGMAQDLRWHDRLRSFTKHTIVKIELVSESSVFLFSLVGKMRGGGDLTWNSKFICFNKQVF